MEYLTHLLREAWARAVVLPVLVFFAERDLRRGRLHAARTRFLRAALRVPGSFRAHFGLARVYLESRDVALARRELVVARTLAPARFRELRHQLPEPYRHEDHAALPASFRVVPVGTLRGDLPSLGDCVSEEEWLRFERMGPIRPEEAVGVDWDGLVSGPDAFEG